MNNIQMSERLYWNQNSTAIKAVDPEAWGVRLTYKTYGLEDHWFFLIQSLDDDGWINEYPA
jgi:hypothetical protein